MAHMVSIHGEAGSDKIDVLNHSRNSNPRIKVGFDEKKRMCIWDGMVILRRLKIFVIRI